ncbi:DEKNAAC104866 [Brettanomyces naardenensis]|uniref:DEKNAAC104866 n=1 Tax=Brettanomyces naardenensis TaxID=13370 RepID=A0A448YSB7_BRENA|nr:DEKNAAC104866 [Brettanomyces naardenensis]
MNKKKNAIPAVNTSHLPPASSLFPDLDKLRKEANEKAKNEHPIGHRLGGSKDHNDGSSPFLGAEVALSRLKKLLGGGNKKRSGSSSSKSSGPSNSSSNSFLKKFASSSRKQTPTSRIIEISKLKKAAKGDMNVPVTQRVFIWCVYVEERGGIVSEKTPLFVSKAWPVGRMLDSCTDLMKVKNVNNRVTDESQRLTVFRKRRPHEKGKDAAGITDEEFVYVPANGRVAREVNDGDLVYIVRGGLAAS